MKTSNWDLITTVLSYRHSFDWLEDLVEYRGDVFSIGGNPGQYTLPNFLMNYNPNLIGASIGNTLPLDAVDWEHHIIQPFDPRVKYSSRLRVDRSCSIVFRSFEELIRLNQLQTDHSSQRCSIDGQNRSSPFSNQVSGVHIAAYQCVYLDLLNWSIQ